MKKYIGMFTSSTPAFLEKMENALSTGNYEEIANQVHAARTKLVMMGMEESKELSIQIEKACRDLSLNEKPIQAIQRLLDQMRKATEELIQS